MKGGKKFLSLILIICAAAVISLCGCRPLSEEPYTVEKQPAPTEQTSAPAFADNSAVAPLTEGIWQDISEEDVAARFEFTPISETECSVSCTNKDEATYAEIPEKAEIDGKEYIVKELAQFMFEKSAKLKAVSLPKNILDIPVNCFAECGELTTVNFSYIYHLGTYAFFECKKLKDINVSHVSEVGAGAFQGCDGLTNVKLSSARTLTKLAFCDCINLENVYLPQVHSIDDFVFDNCPRLSEIILPETVSYMGVRVFEYSNTQVKFLAGVDTSRWEPLWNDLNENQNVIFNHVEYANLEFTPINETECSVNCLNKEWVMIAEIPQTVVIDGRQYTVTEVAERAFDFHDGIGNSKIHRLERVALPESIKVINKDGFNYCGNLKEIDLSHVESIGYSAFYCTALTSVNLSSTLSVDISAFNWCKSLESVYMPEITEIGGIAFSGCDKLAEVVIPKTAIYVGDSAFNSKTTLVKVAKGTNTEKWDKQWDSGTLDVIYDYLIPAEFGFSRLNDSECSVSCLNTEYVMIADIPSTAIIDGKEYTVTEIAPSGFSYCEDLEQVHLPEGLTAIGEFGFGNCASLKEIILPSTLQIMDAAVFENCDIQIKAVAKEKPDSWDKEWNYGNANQNVIWGWFEGKAVLGYSAISETECEVTCLNKDEVTYAEIPEKAIIDGKEYTVTRIAENAFKASYNLEAVILPDSVIMLNNVAFGYCIKLTQINLSSVTRVGASAFLSCESLTSVNLTSVTQITLRAFRYCTTLESVVIPQVKVIGAEAFRNTKLKEITLPATLQSMSLDVFRNCDTQVYAVAEEKPEGWNDDWNLGNENQNVIWGWKDDIARYEFTVISETECSVRLINKSTAVVAYIPATAEIDGKQYTVTEISYSGFSSSPNLKKVVLPYTVKRIGTGAFGNCPKLNSIALANVEEIGNNAFTRCPELKELVIPKSVTKVGSYILGDNNTEVYARGSSSEGWSENWNFGNGGEVEFNSLYYKPVEMQ